VAVGFGISTAEQAGAAAAAGADGVIVGSRLVRAAGEAASGEAGSGEAGDGGDPVSAVAAIMRELSTGLATRH
jgi:tryptophan synthase alpha chain